MTRIALDIPSASQRLALRRWLEARGEDIRALDDREVDLTLGGPGHGGPSHAVPMIAGSEGPRIDFDSLGRILDRLDTARRELVEVGELPPEGLVAHSAGMRELVDRIERLAPASLSVLVHGESGSGKELVARTLHARGPRRDAPFLAVNCAAIPEGLFESELFGHEKGSFTDASRRREGCLKRAGEGTLFLDEIGELPPTVQAKLLRVLQERKFRRVGGEDELDFQARVISATARELGTGPAFRQDLYHRIAGARLELPPLRERAADLRDLCRSILARSAAAGNPGIQSFETAITDQLAALDWPGNVRQLENLLRQASLFARDSILRKEDLSADLLGAARDPEGRLASALASWVRQLREGGASPAELREALLERLAAIDRRASPGGPPNR